MGLVLVALLMLIVALLMLIVAWSELVVATALLASSKLFGPFQFCPVSCHVSCPRRIAHPLTTGFLHPLTT